MKHVLFVFAGVLLFSAAGFLLGSVATNWYADHFAGSDDDISFSIRLFLIVWPLMAATGGWLGHVIFRRSRPGRA
jgi:tryptophan-rich sensory protein